MKSSLINTCIQLRRCNDVATKIISTHVIPTFACFSPFSQHRIHFLRHLPRLPGIILYGNISSKAITISNAVRINLRTIVIVRISICPCIKPCSYFDVSVSIFVENSLSRLTGKVFSTNCTPSGSDVGRWLEDASGSDEIWRL